MFRFRRVTKEGLLLKARWSRPNKLQTCLVLYWYGIGIGISIMGNRILDTDNHRLIHAILNVAAVCYALCTVRFLIHVA